MKGKKPCLVISLLLVSFYGFTQATLTKGDTAAVNALIEQSKVALNNDSGADETIRLATEAKIMAERIGFPKGEAMAFKYIGMGHYINGSYVGAMENWRQSLSIFESLKDTAYIANLQSNIGSLYQNNGNVSKSLEYSFISLRNSEMVKDTMRMLAALINIGAAYLNKTATYPEAKIYYLKALKLWQASDRQYDYYSTMGLSVVYLNQPDSDSALYYLKKAESVSQSSEDFSLVWINMGKAYSIKKDWETARRYYMRAYDSALATSSKTAQVSALKELGSIFILSDNFKKGIPVYTEAEKIARELNLRFDLIDIYKGLSTIYSRQGNYPMAHRYQSALTDLKDSLHKQQTDLLNEGNEFNSKMLKSDDSIFLAKREELQQLRFDKITAQTQTRIWLLLGGLVLLLSGAGFLFYTNRRKQKINQLLHQQKEEIHNTLTELQSTQQQLIQREKMASLGELTAGIAHEIQNPLNFVNNFSELSNELIDEMNNELENGNATEAKQISVDIKKNLEKIHHHGKRADAIVKGMLQHSRSSTGQKEKTDINALADEYLRLAFHGMRAKDKSLSAGNAGLNAAMKTDYDETIGTINIVPQDIGRVMLNLITNAFYAASSVALAKEGFAKATEGNEPTVWVSTKKKGNNVLITVKDNGPGIPQNILDKIFQPFFTTKPTGQGTGLGLSLSYDIIKAHGGEINVETREGEGTAFIIRLPIG